MDEELLERLDIAVLRGNGKDSLMTRMALTEQQVHGLKEQVENIDRKLSKIGLMVGGVLLTLLSEMIVHGIWR